MPFHLGKSILLMAIFALAGGVWFSVRPEPARRDLTLWVFAGTHFHDYNDVLREPFERESGRTLEVDLLASRAMDTRLPVLFMSPGHSRELPDAAEIEVAGMGRYLRPPVGDVGFLPLNQYLETSGYREIDSLEAAGKAGWNARFAGDGRIYTFRNGRWVINPSRTRPDAWIDRILPSRLAPVTKQGMIFAVPHDVHPVALAFREDLFREAGVPLMDDAGRSTVGTWREFQDKCVRFQAYWRAHGQPTRHAMELPESRADVLNIMLLQRHINVIDADSRIHLNDPIVAQTMAFYVQLVAGDRQIGAETAAESGIEYRDLAEGNICALLMPDWKVNTLREFDVRDPGASDQNAGRGMGGPPMSRAADHGRAARATPDGASAANSATTSSLPQIAGKLRLIPLPRFDPVDAPTAAYGGTAIGIPRGCRHPDEAWKLIEFLYFSPQGLADRATLGILPPLPEEWDAPQYRRPDPFFGGQRAMGLYANLAPRVPPVYVTPVTGLAVGTLAYVQSKAVGYYRAHGVQGLEAQCQRWLDQAAADLARRIAQARFEPPGVQ